MIGEGMEEIRAGNIPVGRLWLDRTKNGVDVKFDASMLLPLLPANQSQIYTHVLSQSSAPLSPQTRHMHRKIWAKTNTYLLFFKFSYMCFVMLPLSLR